MLFQLVKIALILEFTTNWFVINNYKMVNIIVYKQSTNLLEHINK
jgi:hypothetical protein